MNKEEPTRYEAQAKKRISFFMTVAIGSNLHRMTP